MFRNLARKKPGIWFTNLPSAFFFHIASLFSKRWPPQPPQPHPHPIHLALIQRLVPGHKATDVAEVQVVVRKADVLHGGDPWSVDWWTGG